MRDLQKADLISALYITLYHKHVKKSTERFKTANIVAVLYIIVLYLILVLRHSIAQSFDAIHSFGMAYMD